jgi:hypothetical protein
MMVRAWRTPLLPVGIALCLLGIGNWILSSNRLVEYTQRSRPSNSAVLATDLSDFPELTPRLNEVLLRRGATISSDVEAKVEFYRTVKRGGRVLVGFGLFLIGLAPIHARRRADHHVLGATS